MTTSTLAVLQAAQRLHERGEPYALVSVVRAEAPASARPGDKAVVDSQGRIDGWIGGGCAQPAVLRTVRQALADGRARMIRIAPTGEEESATRELGDVLEFGMTCHSGGTLELFVDPMLPRARLVLFGDSPVAQALAGLAPRVGFDVTVVAHGADALRFPDAARVVATDDAAEVAAQVPPGAFAVVVTQGRRDVQGLRAALAVQARQVAFVASARKAQVLRESLVAAGADASAVAAIVAPAGASIGAQTPEEIALSVLAGVVAARRGAGAVIAPPTAAPVAAPAGAKVSSAAAAARARLAARETAAAPAASCCGGEAAAAVEAPAVTAPGGSCCGG
jgi:xanthine dehydrogenase accessory factor